VPFSGQSNLVESVEHDHAADTTHDEERNNVTDKQADKFKCCDERADLE